MKRIFKSLLIVVLLSGFGEAYSQVLGDYRSVTITGNWSVRNSWQRWNGAAWAIPTGLQGYPGQRSIPGTVTVQILNFITLDVTPPFGVFNLTVQNVAAVTETGANSLSIAGALTLDAIGFLTFNGTGSLAVLGISTIDGYLTDNNNSGVDTFTGRVTVSGLAGFFTTAVTSSGNMIFKNGLTHSGAFFTAGGATFNTANQTIDGSSAMSFDNSVTVTGITLTNNNTNTITLTNTGAGMLTGTGTFMQGANSTLEYAGATMTITTLNASAAGNRIIYNSTAAQTLFSPSAGTYANLTTNNTFGTSPQVSLPAASNIIVSNNLTMTAGNLNLNLNMLTIGTAPGSPGTLTHGGTSASGWIYGGSIVRYFNTGTIANRSVTGLFPIGTASDFRPFYVAASAAITTGGTVTLSYTNAATTSIVSFVDSPTATLVVLRHDAFWTVATAGLAGGTYNLSVEGTGFGTVGNVNDLRITRVASTIGTDGAHAGTTANPQANRTGLTLAQLAGNFYIGSINAVSSPLPIRLLSFTGSRGKNATVLKWITESEINFDYFVLERSGDGYEFETVAKLKGKGSSSSRTEYAYEEFTSTGLHYYRLKSVDLDGTTSFSNIIKLDGVEALSFNLAVVYPNPVSNRKLTLQFFDNDPGVAHIILTDQMGVRYPTQPVDSDSNQLSVPESLAPGMYILEIVKGSKRELIRLVVQ